jgi:hypothetical protein
MSVDFAMTTEGALALGPDGDLVEIEGDPAVRARLLRAFVTERGEIPFFPDTGAGAPSKEGGPPVAGDELARAVLAEARRDPDVLEASGSQVSRGSTGVTTVTCRVRTRFSPDAPQTLALRLP